jgi:cytochrome c biogenesis protein CcdA
MLAMRKGRHPPTIEGRTPVEITAYSSGRRVAAWALAFGALGVAVVAAVGAGPSGGGLALGIATLSSRLTDALQLLGDRLPLGYSFGAGMVTVVNPCGFALLPAYLGLYLGTSVDEGDGARSIGRALVVGGAMTAGFVMLFGLIGLVLGLATAALADVLPWVSLLIGALLALVGGQMLAGADLHASVATRLASRLGDRAKRSDLVGYTAYGVAFALTSLGCTLPLFLTVVATGLTAGGLTLAASRFLIYALGMGVVVTGATVLIALSSQALVAQIGAIGRFLRPVSAVLLVLSGAYVVYYWLTVGGLLG